MAKTQINGMTKSERTKQLIFESALTLFKQSGFEQVSVEDITGYAGVSKGSFYTHFNTKSDIIVEEFWTIDSYYRTIAVKLESQSCATEKLLKFTEYQMCYVRDIIGCDMLKILYANQILKKGSDKVIIDQHRFWHTYIAETIEKGQKVDELTASTDAHTLATYFNRAIRGILLDWIIKSGSFDLVKAAQAYCRDFLLKGFFETGI